MARPARVSRARFLKRVFDLECCPKCGGSLNIIAAIEAPPVIASILTHLRLSARPRLDHARGELICFRRLDAHL